VPSPDPRSPVDPHAHLPWWRPSRRALVVTVVMGALGLLSMGALGAVLHLAVSPTLPLADRSIDALTGDWVWPAMIAVGMGWSFAFLAADLLDRRLRVRGVSGLVRGVAWVGVLWGWAAVLWNLTVRLR